jgi:ATP-dependent helicase/nuclease subunit B
MGRLARAEIDAWLRDGGIVLAASDRAARALTADFHRARQAEGLSAWIAPNIQDWNSFVRKAWSERSLEPRLLLNSLQEESLWAEIAGRERRPATLLDGPRRRIAALAMHAQDLLASHAPKYLSPGARVAWQQDAEVFSGWLTKFDQICRDNKLLSASRIPLELIGVLEEPSAGERPPLLVAGFDRVLPAQRNVFDAWGAWRELAHEKPAAEIKSYGAETEREELTACALWCRLKLASNPNARLLIVTQDVAGRRGELERALLKYAGGAPLYEFSLGVPLAQVALAKTAHLLLRWLAGPIDESEIDWLFSTGFAAASQLETAHLQRAMRELRRRGEQRTVWTLEAFVAQKSADNEMHAGWAARMMEAQRRLALEALRRQSAIEWASLVPLLLKAAGWPGSRSLATTEFQAANRWQHALEACGSLGFDGRRMRWRDFMAALARALDETLFAPESQDAPIQIAGPAESAGLTADAVWFLGADEDAWPAAGSTHPFLPLHVQREGAMPHAAAQLDWKLAHAITARLLASAPEVHFSYSRQMRGVETQPSRVVAQLAGEPLPLPAELAGPAGSAPITIAIYDESRVPFTKTKVIRGAEVLTSQSQCPFKAFATARLGARGWEPGMAGLTPAQRGQLIHAMLRAVWAGKPRGIRSLDDLRELPDRGAFVAVHVQRVFDEQIPAGVRERMPRRYLDLEQSRLTGLIAQWLEYEATRLQFSVSETEVDRPIELAGLSFHVRLDRVDKLNDGSALVIDYKTGDVSPKSWELPRPDDVQMPLYAGFALDRAREPLGGLVFARLRAGESQGGFAGSVFQPAATLFGGLKSSDTLVRNALTLEQLFSWRDYIEQTARDFVAGASEVAPRDYPKTCQRCGLQVLCRIQETRGLSGDDEESGSRDADNE